MKRKFTDMERGYLSVIEEVVANEGHDVEELCALLNITVEDILSRFQDRMIENKELFIPSVVQVEPLPDEEDDDETPEGSW